MSNHNTVHDADFVISENYSSFNYQKNLTEKLDKLTYPFDQNTINEIVLWKTNRYAMLKPETLALINNIDQNLDKLDLSLTREVLTALLKEKGVQLPMASTILRFRNKNIYQIIDQRVYRIIYKNEKLKVNTYSSERNIKDQIDLYVKYITDLRTVCDKLKIQFHEADRILYMADKKINAKFPLDNYGISSGHADSNTEC